MFRRNLLLTLVAFLFVSSSVISASAKSDTHSAGGFTVNAISTNVLADSLYSLEGYASLERFPTGPGAVKEFALMGSDGKLIFDYGKFASDFFIQNGIFVNRLKTSDESGNEDSLFDLTGKQVVDKKYYSLEQHYGDFLIERTLTDKKRQNGEIISTTTLIDNTGKKVLDIPMTETGYEIHVGGYSEGLLWFFCSLPIEENISEITEKFNDATIKDEISPKISCGYMDKDGNVIIKQQFSYVYPFKEGLASARKENVTDTNGLYGYIDKAGETVIDFKFGDAKPFYDGYASVADENNKYGYIDKTGKMVIPFEYSYSLGHGDGLFAVSKYSGKEFKYGFVNNKNEVVVPLIYDYVTPFNNKTAYALKGGKVVLLKIATIAKPTSAKVLINGKDTTFDAYEIKGHNYFKLRDLAFSLTGTEKQFDVAWSEEKNAISLISNKAYTKAGGEMSKKGKDVKVANPTDSKIILDGSEISLTAYNIDYNNYFKLRDIGEKFDFGIDWDPDKYQITIDTKKGY